MTIKVKTACTDEVSKEFRISQDARERFLQFFSIVTNEENLDDMS